MIDTDILNINKELKLESKNIISIITKKTIFNSSNVLLKNTLKKFCINKRNIASCIQTHSSNVLYVKNPALYQNADGIITHLNSNIILKIQTADCIPIFLVDKISGLIGLVHSGWKGTNNNIIKNAISIFLSKDSKLKNIVVYLGPSIKSCCYEIKNDVSQLFNKDYLTFKKNKIFLDINKKVNHDLLNLGLMQKNISISNICTYENVDYCSYRRDKENADRMFSLFGALN